MMIQTKRITREQIPLILVICIIFLFSIRTVANFDTGFHLATGKFVVQNMTVPLHDVFSYTAQGVALIAHYWLGSVIFYGVYMGLGYVGLMLFVACVSTLSYVLLYKAGKIYTGKETHPLILLALAFLMFELWVVRSQIFSYLCVAVLLFLLAQFEKTGAKKWIYFTVPLMVVWANLHAGVVLGIAILGWYGITFLYKHISAHHNIPTFLRMLECCKDRGKRKEIGTTLGTLVLAIGSTLINPNGYKTLIYSKIISQSISRMQIAEWKSFFFYAGQSWQSLVYLGIMLCAVLLFLSRVRNVAKERGVGETIWLGGLLIAGCALSIISIRHTGFMPFLAYLPVSVAIATIEIKKEKIKSMVKFGAMAFLVLVCIQGIIRWASLSAVDSHLLPVGASRFIRDHELKGRMFNTQPLGGTLIWELWPEREVYYDGRSELYAGEMDEEMWNVMSGSVDPLPLFEKRGIEYAVMHYRDPNTIVPAPTAAALFLKLTHEGSFRMVYWDDAAIVLVRTEGLNASVAQESGYEYINPFFIKQGSSKDIALEFERALREAPDSDSVRLTAQSIFLGK